MGPIAPKDPVKKRDFYYIMLEKQISAAPAPDGKGVTFIYEDGGRLISSSRITGNITDEEMLKLLRDTEGFKKLVYGIGVSMMAPDVDGADFVFQMYGRKDTYGSGTVIRQHISSEGVEYLIPLNEVEWSDDDREPGQIRFEFEKSGILATVNVRFYLNDGFKAPEFEGIDPVDTSSEAYKNMIKGSLIQCGDMSRLKAAIAKAKRGEDTTVAFIGGSITQGAGATPINTACYTYKAFEAFKEKFGKGDNVHYIKAGVGGTPSELGIVRYDEDVLDNGKNHPDVVVIEFAVNDAGDETEGDCYEGLLRRAYYSPEQPAVILLFSVFVDDYNLEDRLRPIGEHYDVPMISIKSAVTKQFYKSKDEGRIIAKNRFFYDCFHPANIGHTIMGDCFANLFDVADDASEEAAVRSLTGENTKACRELDFSGRIKALRSSDFENIKLIDRKKNDIGAEISCGGFSETDTVLQNVERNLDAFATPEFPNNWMHTGETGSEAFSMKLKCSRLLLVAKDSCAPSDGKADIFVDGKKVKTYNPHDIGWTHCNAVIIIREKECGEHLVEIKMDEGDEDKNFTILGFGYDC